MVISTLCPAVHILGSQNEYSRAEGIADYYWPCAVCRFALFVTAVLLLEVSVHRVLAMTLYECNNTALLLKLHTIHPGVGWGPVTRGLGPGEGF